ncbi:cytochrome P450 [Apiospora arundinis]
MKSLTTALCALLGQSTIVLGQGYTNESEVPLYGLSPPVYPSPQGAGSTSARWTDAYARARTIVAQATLEEKLNLTYGHVGQCVGNTGSIARLGVPALCFSDAPDGIRGNEFVSAFPAGIHVAATWDRDLMYKYGRALGDEYRGKGRVVRGGRNWEGLSNDPYLAGAGMGTVVRGMQDAGVMANPKHWLLTAADEQPTSPASASPSAPTSTIELCTSSFVFPFMDGLKEGAVSVMCSYQRVNNSYGCQNSKMLNGILKTELGFEGFVLSDWGAQHSGVASANAGLDIVMPDAGYWGQNLTNAVNNGSVSAERATDMATRIIAAWYYTNQDNGSFPSPGVYNNLQKHDPIDVQGDHGALIREIGAAGTVLVKNVNGTLPLKKPTFVYVVGYDAQVASSPWQNPSRYGGGYEVNFGWETLKGTLITGGGSGSSAPAYVVSPFDAIRDRVVRDRGILRWDFDLTDEFSDQLVKNTAANCSNTIVVIHSTGIRTVDAWIDHPNVTAVLYAGLPGQESGHSIVDVLWGDVAPSGKLPFTVAKQESDYGHMLNATVTFEAFPQQDFTEGLYIDYRAFDRDGVEPLYPFGHATASATRPSRAEREEGRGHAPPPGPGGPPPPGTFPGPAQQWRLQAGSYKIHVGASSRDIKLEGTLEIAA